MFTLNDPHRTSYLYFPLVNEAGMMSVITPTLHGDIKTGQNSFLTTPVSVEDLHNSRSARNFWVYVESTGAWSATGNSAPQIAQSLEDAERVTLDAGLLWHKVTRESPQFGLRAEITNFVPPSKDQVELMQVALTNVTDHPLTLTPTAAILIYGRSADNLRDHRHVTSLLHRIATHPYGVLVRPTLSFDERGHHPNSVTYGVLGTEADGSPPMIFARSYKSSPARVAASNGPKRSSGRRARFILPVAHSKVTKRLALCALARRFCNRGNPNNTSSSWS